MNFRWTDYQDTDKDTIYLIVSFMAADLNCHSLIPKHFVLSPLLVWLNSHMRDCLNQS